METTLKPKRPAQLARVTGGVVGLLLLLAILIAINVIASGFRVRKDLTAERLYTLSPGTRRVLDKLDRPVTLKFFFTRGAEIPGPLKLFAQQVEDLLHEYQLAARGRIVVEIYDPQPDSDAEDWANRYGIAPHALGLGGPMLYLGLVAVAGDNQAVLPSLDPRMETLLEYHITRMIHRVTLSRKPVVGVMSSLPVLGSAAMPYPMPGQPRPQPPWVSFRELQDDYELRTVPTTADEIETNLDALIVVHPKNLSDRTLYALDQFVLRGGRLLAFLDPCSVVDSGASEDGAPYGLPGRSSDLGRLLDAWGVGYQRGRVVVDLEAATTVRGRANRIERSPLYLSLRADAINRRDAMTAPLETLLMPMAGAFTGEGTADLTVTPLVSSSERSDLVDAMMAQFNPEGVLRGFKSGLKKLNLAIRLQGKFKTAFPEGPPPRGTPPSSEPTPPPPEVAATNHLTESQEPGNVILVADADMLYNDFTVQELSFFGIFQPINDNLYFLANAVEQMSGSTDLIGIRCRGRSSRPFTRVLALERAAQERWLEEERALEEKLQATQARLNELQQKKDEKQRFILSPEQAREVERFRQDVARYREELKRVRRNLREGIERLGVRVKVINILLMPVLVALAGIGFALARRVASRA